VTARGRTRTLVVAAVASWCFYVGYAAVYLLWLDAPWLLPVPIYVEQSLFVLFQTGAVAGAWTLLRSLLPLGARLVRAVSARGRLGPMRWPRWTVVALMAAGLAVIPLGTARLALRVTSSTARMFYWPWADEPELVSFLAERLAFSPGATFRGSVNFLRGNDDGTIADLWSRGVPTLNEFSQTATAQSLYFMYAFLRRDVRDALNRFEFYWRRAPFPPSYWAVSQLLGVRYTVEREPLPEEVTRGLPLRTLPYHVPEQPEPEPSGLWYVHELPRPNLGDYSPTEVMTLRSGAGIAEALSRPGVDLTRQVALTVTVDVPLVPARDVRLAPIRNGWHVSGRSDGTSLLVLPQQFSHCLRTGDRDVHLVRADLMLTGVMFTGRLATEITFDYGIFSPWCRLEDLADIKSLDLRIDLRKPHLRGGRILPPWREALARLDAAVRLLPALR
jgi:hypothetical protein